MGLWKVWYRNTKQIHSVDISITRGFLCQWIGRNIFENLFIVIKIELNNIQLELE